MYMGKMFACPRCPHLTICRSIGTGQTHTSHSDSADSASGFFAGDHDRGHDRLPLPGQYRLPDSWRILRGHGQAFSRYDPLPLHLSCCRPPSTPRRRFMLLYNLPNPSPAFTKQHSRFIRCAAGKGDNDGGFYFAVAASEQFGRVFDR